MTEEYSVKLNEDFGPVPTYRPYLMLISSACMFLTWGFIGLFVGGIILSMTNDITMAVAIGLLALAILIALGITWSILYFKTVKYHLNATEVSWKRGVLFHTTGIVPYNRITDINIHQGPLMRAFGISHLRIQTAGGGSAKGLPEIQIEGQIHAEELRAMIMDYVRGNRNAGGATVGVAEEHHIAARQLAPESYDELLNEVREIRKLLEKK